MTYEYWAKKNINDASCSIGWLETYTEYLCENCSWFNVCVKLGTPECKRYNPVDPNYTPIILREGIRV